MAAGVMSMLVLLLARRRTVGIRVVVGVVDAVRQHRDARHGGRCVPTIGLRMRMRCAMMLRRQLVVVQMVMLSAGLIVR